MRAVALFHLFYFGLYRPSRAIANRHTPGAPMRPIDYSRRMVATGIVCAGISIVTIVAMAPGWPGGRQIALYGSPDWRGFSVALSAWVAMTAADVVLTRRRLRAGDQYTLQSAPTTGPEKAWWTLGSVTAGVGEELTWRVAQPQAILLFSGSEPLAVIASACLFGVGHIRAGRTWALITVAFAVVQQAIVTLLPGGLFLAMGVHIGVNLVVGFDAGQFVARAEFQAREARP